MKKRKFISGILAGALIATSVFTGGWNEAKAANEDNLVASYSFENSLANAEGSDEASALVKGLGAYNGTPTYEEGFSGNAIRLNGYGLKLNQQNLGENFTVSMWLKPDDVFAENQTVAFLGYHDPQKWIAVAGGAEWNEPSSAKCKFWGNDENQNVKWKTYANVNIDTSWHKLNITGSADMVTLYLDGVKVGEADFKAPLAGKDQDIYIGVTNWDNTFSGLIDEVQVYQCTLSEDEIEEAYLAEMADPEDDKLADYEFESSLADKEGSEASALVTGLKDYTGEVKYEAGFRGEAVRLGDYGLKLNKENLGDDFTVSMWVKPDGTFAENQVLAFLGYHDQEKWIGFSGNKTGTSECKFWARDVGGVYPSHTTLGRANVDTSWHQLTITGTQSTVTAYLDGVQVGSGATNSPLNQENGDIYIGVNNWDAEFSGLVDDVALYGRALTLGEINKIYTDSIFEADMENISVPAEVKWDITLPTKGNSGQTAIEWTSDKPEFINPTTGEVTRPAKGAQAETVTLTAKVTLGGTSKEKTFTVTVLPVDPATDIDDYTEWLTLNAAYVSSDISLPDKTADASVTWESSDKAVITDDGKVSRPEGENETVTLTATITLDGNTRTKEFPLTVLAQGPDVLTYISDAPATGQNGGMKIAGESGDAFSVLHSDQPILYASKGTRSFGAAHIFRKADGSFGVVASDGGNNGNLIFFSSDDLITYSDEKLVSIPGVSSVKAVDCVYDSADNVDTIYVQDADGKVWAAKSADLTTVTSVTASDYTFPTVEGAPSDAVNPYATALTQAEYDVLVKKFASITNTGVQAPANVTINQGENYTLPEKVTAEYSDGSTKQLGVEWNADDLEKVNTSVPGEYTVNGTVQRTISYTDPENPLIEERADPYMVYNEDDGYYYFTGSYPMNGSGDAEGYDRLVLRRSKTIEGLADAEEVVIWDENESAELGRFIWAPELHKIGDSWYFVSTAGLNSGTGTTFNIRPFMVKCNNPEDMMNPDSWGDPVLVKAYAGDEKNCVNAMSLDMTYFEADGVSYLAWADFTQTGISSIYIATIDPSNPTQLTSPCSIISAPEYSWEYVRATVNEGPAVFKNNGKVYMAFSASGTGSEYCVGLLTADEGANLLDPDSWVKSNYPLLTSTDFNDEVSGPGHNSFTVDEYGNVIIVYHARPASIHAGHGGDPLYDPCRYAYLQPVNIAADGSPVLNMTPKQELADEYMNVSVKIVVSGTAVKNELTKIEVTTQPTKTTYEVGEAFDPTGIQVTATYTKGDTKVLGADAAGLEFSPKEFTQAGQQQVTVLYTDGNVTRATSVNVTVNEKEEEPVLTGIKITTTPTKTTYKVGESFDPTGMVVTAFYDSKAPQSIDLAKLTITPEVFEKAGAQTVTVSYTEGGETFETTLEVTVTAEAGEPGKDPADPGKDPAGPGQQDPDASQTTPDEGGTVQTGDATNIIPAALTCIIAFAAAAAAVGMKRRKRG